MGTRIGIDCSTGLMTAVPLTAEEEQLVVARKAEYDVEVAARLAKEDDRALAKATCAALDPKTATTEDIVKYLQVTSPTL